MRVSRTVTVGLSAVLMATAIGGTAIAQSPAAPAGSPAVAKPGQAEKMLLLPKFLGISVFDEADQGAQEAATELQNPTPLDFTGPAAGDPPANQIDSVTNAPT